MISIIEKTILKLIWYFYQSYLFIVWRDSLSPFNSSLQINLLP